MIILSFFITYPKSVVIMLFYILFIYYELARFTFPRRTCVRTRIRFHIILYIIYIYRCVHKREYVLLLVRNVTISSSMWNSASRISIIIIIYSNVAAHVYNIFLRIFLFYSLIQHQMRRASCKCFYCCDYKIILKF